MSHSAINKLDAAAVLPPGSGSPSGLWTEIHERFQAELAALESEVRGRVPGVRVASGRTQGTRFYLFSYRTFSMPDTKFDPVVSGVTFAPAPQGISVTADVSGEQTGDLIASIPNTAVANSRDELLAAARESARTLSQYAAAIATALDDSSRKVE